MWLDALVGALGAGALALVLAFDQLLELSGNRLPVVLTNLAYPIADLTLLVVAVGVLAVIGVRGSRAWWFLIAGLLVYAVADTVYAVQLSAGTYVEGGALDSLWPLAAVCLAFAATSPPLATARSASASSWWAVIVVPACFSVSSLAILAYGRNGELSSTASAMALAAVAAGGVRAGLTYREVSQLRAREVIRSADARLQARTDELTGLTNRRGFAAGLDEALAERLDDQALAVLLIDLDRFKEINDALGHHAGDDLLRLVGQRLSGCVRNDDLLARLGGDEFAIALRARDDPETADAVAQRILDALALPCHLDDIALHLGASIGIALCPTHSTDAAALLQQADVAMYDAKSSRGGWRNYNPTRDTNSRDRLATIEGLRAAIGSGQLVLHYQPKIDLVTGAVTGTEALVRWQHPQRGLLAPETFLALAEQTGLMRPLTEVVLREALGQLHRWRQQGRDLTMAMAVNISASNLLDASLPAHVSALLTQYELPASLVQLEITETTLMADPLRAAQVVASLLQLGVTASVDDYGTGYSSLAYLRDLSVAELKLDRSFILDICRDPRASAIVRSTVDLAHSLGMRMVAEGVEDADGAQALSSLGCDIAQGFHYSRPVPAAELERWLNERAAVPPALAGGLISPE
ncbi:MAG: EAL domain-containing protein [Actinomycetota bacterium]|nr:EAL domain-containing protein [Actinomycetota bacterium]